MLPYFMRYDHTNYIRWGTIYINEMHRLPPEVKREFDAGNFVVKRTNQRFNQVDPDQSQEWLNGIGKKRGGIIGITKTSSALSRWALSYNLRSHLPNKTRAVYGLDYDDDYSHNESFKGRQTQDSRDEDSLLATLKSFNLFSDEARDDLQNIATKDIVTKEIEDHLLGAHSKGQEKLNTSSKSGSLLQNRDRSNSEILYPKTRRSHLHHSTKSIPKIPDRKVLRRPSKQI